MSERNDYTPPEARINWDRSVAGEEQHNNYHGINQAMVDLIHIRAIELENGATGNHVIDDLDNDTMISVPTDEEWKKMVLFGVGFGRQQLAREGILIDFRPQRGEGGGGEK